MYWEGVSKQCKDILIFWFKRIVAASAIFVEFYWRCSLFCDAHADAIQEMLDDGASALHIAADNDSLDVGTLEPSWRLMSIILLRRCIPDTFINFMQTMHFIHAAKYHFTDDHAFTMTAWVRLWRRSRLRISQHPMRQLKAIETASYSDYHYVRWRILSINLT